MALEVVKMTTSSAANDNKVGIKKTLTFQCNVSGIALVTLEIIVHGLILLKWCDAVASILANDSTVFKLYFYKFLSCAAIG